MVLNFFTPLSSHYICSEKIPMLVKCSSSQHASNLLKEQNVAGKTPVSRPCVPSICSWLTNLHFQLCPLYGVLGPTPSCLPTHSHHSLTGILSPLFKTERLINNKCSSLSFLHQRKCQLHSSVCSGQILASSLTLSPTPPFPNLLTSRGPTLSIPWIQLFLPISTSSPPEPFIAFIAALTSQLELRREVLRIERI